MARPTFGTPASQVASSQFTLSIHYGESQPALSECVSKLLDALQPIPVYADSIGVAPFGGSSDHHRIGRLSPTCSSLKSHALGHRFEYDPVSLFERVAETRS